ncbi:hypothetical protein EG68_04259, partial [Paragonimus skrjabini miyazakii]
KTFSLKVKSCLYAQNSNYFRTISHLTLTVGLVDVVLTQTDKSVFRSCAVILGASYLLVKQWKASNDFAQLNKSPVFPEDLAADAEKNQAELLSPTESLPDYSQLGLNPNEPI